MSRQQSFTVLFISSAHKGDPMIAAVKATGCHVILLTEESLRDETWPADSIDEIVFTPDLKRYQGVINTVTWMCRAREIHQILPLDEFEVELVSILREHLNLPGMGATVTRHFRDKLMMRHLVAVAQILEP
jgi:hypothetical protein